MENARYLILENGQVFQGRPFGASGQVTGEIVFTTSMTGYLETLTDPSYYGQMVVQTFPLIGNYGVIPADFEGESPALKAYIVRDWCQEPSNFRSEEDLDTFLLRQNVVGLWDIDTRALVKIIREHGVMNAILTDDPAVGEAALQQMRAYTIQNAVHSVSCPVAKTSRAEHGTKTVVLWDFGAKRNISRELLLRGCNVVSVPAQTTAQEILALQPDGLMLSNGPGDPAENTGIIRELARVCEAKLPIFGICLGHQLLALARGGQTMKLKYGHRGANQPVQECATGKVHHEPEPRLCRLPRGFAAKAGAAELHQPQRPNLRGNRLSRHPRVFGTVSSGGLRRPAGHKISLRPVYCAHGRKRQPRLTQSIVQAF
jgi:carbamoyl-phosphate synthase small subunit